MSIKSFYKVSNTLPEYITFLWIEVWQELIPFFVFVNPQFILFMSIHG